MPRYRGVWVALDQLRREFDDTDAEVLWLIVVAPKKREFLHGSQSTGVNLSRF